MSSNRNRVKEIKVCPQDSDYAVVNCDDAIRLYKYERRQREDTLLSTIAENKRGVKYFDWYPKKDSNPLLALALNNGKIVLDRLESSLFSDKLNLYGKELTSSKTVSRHCNALSWNKAQTNLLAQSFDKQSKEPAIVVWDIHTHSGGSVLTGQAGGHHGGQVHQHHRSSGGPSDLVMRPIYEHALSDIGHSMTWTNTDGNILIAGLSHKYIKVFDIRENKPRNCTFTKAVFNIQIDPFDTFVLASNTDTEVNIWDLRKFDKPLLIIPQERQIVNIEWSPLWHGMLACLTKDSPSLQLIDIKNTVAVEDNDSKIIDRIIQPYENQDVLTFTWHRTIDYCLLTYNNSGVKNVRVHERKAICWSANNSLSWTSNKHILQSSIDHCRPQNTEDDQEWMQDDNLLLSNDISIRIKERALMGYGIQANILDNIKLVGDFSDSHILRNLWKWLHIAKMTSDPNPMLGIKYLLDDNDVESTSQLSDYINIPISDVVTPTSTGDSRFHIQRKVYNSKIRSKALHYCGWGHPDNEINSFTLISDLENQCEFERAATIAVFTLRLERALQVFKNKPSSYNNPTLSLIAISLSGFTESKDSIWREHVQMLSRQLDNPYIRAMFNFLIYDSNSYETILQDDNLLISDRVAFACLYLDDEELSKYICDLTSSMVSQGRLDGLLLTGFLTDGINLITKYIDTTSDIQTAACVVTLANLPCPHPSSTIPMTTASLWIEDYQDLLDEWKLWHQRAEFDLYQNVMNKRKVNIVNCQVFICCNFCGKSVSFQEKTKLSSSESRTANIRSKPISCPKCGKPMPKCSICMMNMGVSITVNKPINTINDWFTLCQTCGHCGHAGHLKSWFSTHTECPISGCKCQCFSLDNIGRACLDSRITT